MVFTGIPPGYALVASHTRREHHDFGHRIRRTDRHQGQELRSDPLTKDCLENALRLQTFIGDAERDGDTEVAQLFRKAQSDSRKGAELAKTLLSSRL